jgi:hypothetical protein
LSGKPDHESAGKCRQKQPSSQAQDDKSATRLWNESTRLAQL